MLSLEYLGTRFSDHFSVFEPITESIARCIRSKDSRPFAVYYIDISQRLPLTLEELDAYQDRFIGSRYFEGSKSLQWSQYLYFVVAGNVDADTRNLVECDRKYARKFVVNEEELTSALTPPKFQVAEGVIDAGILSTWNEHLGEANLEHVIYNNDSLPQRIRLIEAGFGHKGLAKPSAVTKRSTAAPPFIATIELNRYRPCPVQSSFDLGTVTLFTGPNGTGKTSLLEAIELLYCGINQRDPKSRSSYTITAAFINGKKETARNGVPSPSELRDRNLAWYGQTDIRTNTLYQSFSRYNFLNTDAAVGLAGSKSDFEEDLSKLLVGPDASKTWREIERTSGELEKTLKELMAVEQQVQLELNAVERQLAASAAVPKVSDALLKSLAKTLSDAGWPVPVEVLPDQVSRLIAMFAARGQVVEEALACEWVGTPITVRRLRQFVEEVEKVVIGAESAVNDAQGLLREASKFDGAIQELDRKEKAIRELTTYLEYDFAQKEEGLRTAERALRDIQQVLSAEPYEVSAVEAIPDAEVPLRLFHEQNQSQHEQAEAAVNASRNRLSDFTESRDQAQALAQQLRDIASQILSDAKQPNTCPLCHAEYGKGQLHERMFRDVDGQLELQSRKLREDLRRAEKSFAAAKQAATVSEWLVGTADRLGVEQDVELRIIKRELVELFSQKEVLQRNLIQARSACETLREMGLTDERYKSLRASVFVDDSASSLSLDGIRSLLVRLDEDRRSGFASASECRKRLGAKLTEISGLLGEEELTFEESQRLISKRRGWRDITRSIIKKIDANNSEFVFQDDQLLADLHTATSLIRRSLSEVQVAVANENQAIAEASVASRRKDELKEQLRGLEPRIKRLRDAQAVFKEILEKHSLTGATEAALQKNKAAIEDIFRRIHSPAEFSGLRNMTTLIRKNGALAELQQISTGQRAALALSLFLAQNAQLRSAPPLMLIDDPIAHVDDLNSLSFLDYLREVALSGERQIVFATANEKLASLFERKFDFLGKKFKMHSLNR